MASVMELEEDAEAWLTAVMVTVLGVGIAAGGV
jgi:hypothetical protein